MATTLILEYDREADILHISKCPPYKEQESEDLGDEVIARLNPVTRDVEDLEILFFSKRLGDGTSLELPISADFHLNSDA